MVDVQVAQGTVAGGYERIAEVFERIVEEQPDAGAALSVRRDGESIIDVWGGVADAATGRAWRADTPSLIFSGTKGLMSILAARLVQAGELEYSRPVADYWPEFGQHGKDRARVSDILAHRAGLPTVRADLSAADIQNWDLVTSRLAAEEPFWQPGTAHAYHPITHGWLIGEVLRRITGLMPGDLLRRELADPLDVDAWIGLPPGTNERVADVTAEPLSPADIERFTSGMSHEPPAWTRRSATLGVALPPELVGPRIGFNDPAIRAAQIPGAGGIATASALATIWSSTVVTTEGVRSLDDATRLLATTVQSEGQSLDGAPAPHSRWGMGFQLDSPARRYLGDTSFGHDGAGGQVMFADPVSRVGFAFITNRMMAFDDRRATDLVNALRSCIDG